MTKIAPTNAQAIEHLIEDVEMELSTTFHPCNQARRTFLLRFIQDAKACLRVAPSPLGKR